MAYYPPPYDEIIVFVRVHTPIVGLDEIRDVIEYLKSPKSC